MPAVHCPVDAYDVRYAYFRVPRKYLFAAALFPVAALFHDTMAFFSRLSAPFSRRETWAWEMPMRLETSVWVLPS